MHPTETQNLFCPDAVKGHPYSVEVELLLGGIARSMFKDGTMQFMDQDTGPSTAFSPRLELEAFCREHIDRYREHHDLYR